MRLLASLLVLLTLANPPVQAQASARGVSDVYGRVVDGSAPVVGAEVRLVDDNTGAAISTTSEEGGEFVFRDVSAGSWRLSARRIGYLPHAESLLLQVGTSQRVLVSLKPLPQSLDTVTVLRDGVTPARYGPSSRMEEFYRRRARGRGRFYTREELEESGRSKLTDLLRLVPGARVKTYPGNLVEVAFARCSGPVRLRRSGSLSAVATGSAGAQSPWVALYVDGVRIDTASVKQVLAEFYLGEIEALEVYRGVSELPPESVGNACAAIYIWTRFGPGPKVRP
ncbi:MAG: carboxypeptidase regulatory-like domain-containing protein [Gemmatimonadaceae bacterium]